MFCPFVECCGVAARRCNIRWAGVVHQAEGQKDSQFEALANDRLVSPLERMSLASLVHELIESTGQVTNTSEAVGANVLCTTYLEKKEKDVE